MSGGSYNYLSFKIEDDPLNADQQLVTAMAERLAGLGYHDAARETYDALFDIRATRARFEARTRRLGEVWRQVEWMDSGDSGPEHVAAEVEKYRSATP